MNRKFGSSYPGPIFVLFFELPVYGWPLSMASFYTILLLMGKHLCTERSVDCISIFPFLGLVECICFWVLKVPNFVYEQLQVGLLLKEKVVLFPQSQAPCLTILDYSEGMSY